VCFLLLSFVTCLEVLQWITNDSKPIYRRSVYRLVNTYQLDVGSFFLVRAFVSFPFHIFVRPFLHLSFALQLASLYLFFRGIYRPAGIADEMKETALCRVVRCCAASCCVVPRCS
jgi:hypothetical protein